MAPIPVDRVDAGSGSGIPPQFQVPFGRTVRCRRRSVRCGPGGPLPFVPGGPLPGPGGVNLAAAEQSAALPPVQAWTRAADLPAPKGRLPERAKDQDAGGP